MQPPPSLQALACCYAVRPFTEAVATVLAQRAAPTIFGSFGVRAMRGLYFLGAESPWTTHTQDEQRRAGHGTLE
jgi:hypothetical protein